MAALDGSEFYDHIPKVCNAHVGIRSHGGAVAKMSVDPMVSEVDCARKAGHGNLCETLSDVCRFRDHAH